jgi:hypothetical protein
VVVTDVVTLSPFTAISGAAQYDGGLYGGVVITVAPRYQSPRSMIVPTLTASLSGTQWISSNTTVVGVAPASATLDVMVYRMITTTRWYRVSYLTATVGADGRYTLTVPAALMATSSATPVVYLRVWHRTAAGVSRPVDVDTVNTVYTRRFYLPIVRNGG